MIDNTKTKPIENAAITWIVNLLHSSALIRAVFLFITWMAIWQFGRLVEYTDHASVWFPVAGFTFSSFLVLGSRAFLPILLGAIVSTIFYGYNHHLPLSLNELIWAGFLFGLAHIFPYWIGASWVGHVSRKAENNAPQLIITFLVVAGVSALFTTVLVISSLVVSNQMGIADVNKTILPFWVGDMAGVVVLTPLLSGILIRFFPEPNIDLSDFTQQGVGSFKNLMSKMALNIFLIFITMLLAYLTGTQESSFAIFFLAVTHMWIASTESPIFNVVSLAVSSFLIVLLVHLFGLMEHVMVYQFAINVVAANALFGIAIPQLRTYNDELKQMVSTDALTQVYSRHYMEQRAKVEITQCHEQNLVLSLVIFDLDNFKLINDQYGHTVGDTALQNVCLAAQSCLMRNDVIARFGGDEFILLLPDQNVKMAQQTVFKILNAIGDIKIGKTQMSSSFGIAELGESENFDSLFSRADKALYVSKNSGGNQINLANDLLIISKQLA